jgi:enamine deaminase RidA (YjgF/YER057c/UK114 family)
LRGSLAAVAVLMVAAAAPAATTAAGTGAGTTQGVRVVSAGNFLFPDGVAGTQGDALQQVDEIVSRAHEVLAQRGLSIGAMIQHTIFLKEGAASPIELLGRFHAAATRLAPGLKDRPSVGTIVRVPEFPDKDTLVVLDMVAAAPSKAGAVDEFQRMPFSFGPQEIVETIRVDPVVFTSGFEAWDFEHDTLAPGLDAQIDAIIDKLNVAATRAGLTIGNMLTHTLYVQKGVDPMRVIGRIHPSMGRYTQDLAKNPPVGGIMIVDGMAMPGFLVEMDAVLGLGKPEDHERVPLSEVSLAVSRSVAAGKLIFLSSMPGVDFENQLTTPADVMQQVDIAVKNVHHSLQKSGLGIGSMVKHRLYLKKGAGDPTKVRARFHEAVLRYAPELAQRPSAETFIIVEGLATPERLFEVQAIAARPGP